MKAYPLIQETNKYLAYLEDHIQNVQKAWETMQEKCKSMRFIWDDYVFHTLDREVKDHDLSKLSEEEFIQYRKSFYPVEGEPKYDMTPAWEHHKLVNPHHWENWTKKDFYNPYEAEIHCVHMVIDWVAMSYKFRDSAREYYEKHKDKIELPDWAVKFIYEIFDALEAQATEQNDQ